MGVVNFLKKGNVYGEACFQKTEEISECLNVYDDIADVSEDIVGLTEDGRYATIKKDNEFSEIYIGSTGSGKTDLIARPKILQSMKAGKSVICSDINHYLYENTIKEAKDAGYKIKMFDLDVKSAAASDRFNPLKDIIPGDEDNDVRLNMIAECLLGTSKDPKEAYWIGLEKMAFKAIVLYLCINKDERRSGHNNLPYIYKYITTTSIEEIEDAFSKEKDNLLSYYYKLLTQIKPEHKEQVIFSLGCHIMHYANPCIRELLLEDEFDVSKMIKEKTILYLNLDELNIESSRLAALFISMLLYRMDECADQKTNVKTRLILDEFQNINSIYRFEEYILTNTYPITMNIQSISQLRLHYDEPERILSACRYIGFLGTNDTQTARYFSQALGSKTIVSESNKGKITTTEYLIDADEIQNMDRDQILIIIKGYNPVVLEKYIPS